MTTQIQESTEGTRTGTQQVKIQSQEGLCQVFRLCL